MSTFFRRIAFLLTARRRDRELREEMEFHRLRLEADRPQNEVDRRTMGNVTLAAEDARAMWMWPWLESARQDVLYAARILRRNPAFGAAVVLVMALGIGATTSVFSIIDALVLRSLPVVRPERLVYFDQPSFSYPIFTEVRANGAHIFSALCAWNIETLKVEWTTTLEPTEVLAASGDFYGTLGVKAATGRLLTPDDDRIGGGRDGLVAVLSHAAWVRRFGADPHVVGRTLRIEQRPVTIVGVTAPGFFGVAPGLSPEITIPLTSMEDAARLQAFSAAWIHMLGRLHDGLSREQANIALQTIWPAVLSATISPSTPAGRRAVFLSRQTALVGARTGFSRIRNQFEEPLWILLSLVTLLLAVACGSAANLLLSRGIARRREIAVRLAIGAGRGRIVRQMLTEALLWTAAAAGVGLVIAIWSSSAVVAMMTTRDEPIVLDIALNHRILTFTIALSSVTAIVCALVPAFRATRIDPRPALAGDRQVGVEGVILRRWSLGKALVAAQIALTIVLLAGAALFVRSLTRVLSQDAGFDRERILVVTTDPIAAGYGDERLREFYDQLLQVLRRLPGAESVSLSWYPPISDDTGHRTQSIAVDGAPLPDTPTSTVYFNAVSPAYFDTVGMRLLQGRDFLQSDDASGPRVVIVNESLSRRFFPDQNAVGRRITIGRNKARQDLEVIAVVSDAKYQRLQETPRAIAYLPYTQLPEFTSGENLYAEIRAAGSPRALIERVRSEVQQLDARVPVHLETVSDRIRTSLVKERVLAVLAVTLGLVALALACAGLYGLFAYAISRHTTEIGLRLALGATRAQVLRTILAHCLLLACAGIAGGLAASLALGRLARSMLFQISPTDPLALSAAALVMLMVATLAGLLPARRAASVDPVVALRHE